MKVEVYMEEISWGFVTIEVESEDEITEKAEDAYYEGKVNWTGGDFNAKSYKIVEQ